MAEENVPAEKRPGWDHVTGKDLSEPPGTPLGPGENFGADLRAFGDEGAEGRDPFPQPWWCARCPWKGPEEETVFEEHPELPKVLRQLPPVPEAENLPHLYRSCPRCGAVVYRWGPAAGTKHWVPQGVERG